LKEDIFSESPSRNYYKSRVGILRRTATNSPLGFFLPPFSGTFITCRGGEVLGFWDGFGGAETEPMELKPHFEEFAGQEH
jgi:hypothetical protein